MTLITVQALTVPGEYHGPLTGPFVARLEADEDFSTSEGRAITKGAGYRGFGQVFDCTLDDTTKIFTIASGDAYATTDSSRPNTKYKRLAIYDTITGRLVTALYKRKGIKIPDNVSPTTWRALEIYTEGAATVVVTDMDQVNDLIQEALSNMTQVAAFQTNIPFTAQFTRLATHTMTADLTFTVDDTGAVQGNVTWVRLVGDSTHTVEFDGFKVSSSSGTFDATAGVLNILAFVYDGVDYWVTIAQEAVSDVSAPVVVSAVVEDANPNKLVVTFNEDLDETTGSPADIVLTPTNVATSVAVVGAVATYTLTNPYVFGDDITFSYHGATDPLKDLVGNAVADITDHAVNNNIAATVVAISPDLSSSGSTFFDITYGSGTWTAGAAGVWNHHAKCVQKLPAGTDGYVEAQIGTGSLALGAMDTDDYGNYTVIDYGVFNSGGTFWRLPSLSDTGIATAAGDKIRVRRASGIVSSYYVRAGTEHLIETYAGTHNGDLFVKFVLTGTGDTFTLPKGFGVVDK